MKKYGQIAVIAVLVLIGAFFLIGVLIAPRYEMYR